MNIVPKVELGIDKLFSKTKHPSMSMVHTNTSIGSMIKQIKAHLSIK